MEAKNFIQEGQRMYASSPEQWEKKYPKFLKTHMKLADKIYITAKSNERDAISAILKKDFSSGKIICSYEDVGVDFFLISENKGVNLVEFNATFNPIFKSADKSSCPHGEFIQTFANFSSQHPSILFVADVFFNENMIRHVFTGGEIELTTPTISFQVSNVTERNRKFSSAYRKHFSKEENHVDEFENLLLDTLCEMDPKFIKLYS